MLQSCSAMSVRESGEVTQLTVSVEVRAERLRGKGAVEFQGNATLLTHDYSQIAGGSIYAVSKASQPRVGVDLLLMGIERTKWQT